jgi:RHS repeat-associated protein
MACSCRGGGRCWKPSRRLTSKAPAGEATISYGYDYTGRVLQLQASGDAGPYVYGYDGAGRAISERRPDVGGTVTWTLDGNGNRTTLTWPETGTLAYSTSYAYDALNRLTDVFEGAAAAGVLLGHYGYDALSERTGIAYGGTTSAGGGRAPIATTAASFTTAGQVAQLSHSFNGASLTLGYSYNQDHQRTGVSASDDTFLVSGLAAASHAYAANNLNEYASVDGQTFGYDPKGNLTGDGTFTYAYDAESHLLSATSTGSGGTTATYAYDPQSRRKAKTVNGTTTNYLSVGSREIAEYDGTGNLLRRYVYGPNLDEPLVTVDAAGNHSYHFTDAQGSVVALANASGQLTEKHAYSAYGLTASTTGTAFQFTGRRVDPETGLYYYRARYYSPALGRFLQTDPIGTAGGINLYAYVNNNPTSLTDPFGTHPSDNGGSFLDKINSYIDSAVDAVNSYIDKVDSAVKSAVTFAWGTESDPRPVQLAYNWATGSGPADYNFGPDSLNTQEMQGAPGVAAARDYFYNKYSDGVPDGASVTNYGASFGLQGLFTAGTLTEQFVGSYTIDIYAENNQLRFVLSNDSSFKSFAYGIGPDWERSSFGPGGNMRQTYTWTEPLRGSAPQ